MSDILKQLRDPSVFMVSRKDTADRIEELEERLKAATDDAKEAEDYAGELEAKLAKAVDALTDISRQKRTDELETEYDVEVADFETGYDTCIDVARTTLAAVTGPHKLTGGKDE